MEHESAVLATPDIVGPRRGQRAFNKYLIFITLKTHTHSHTHILILMIILALMIILICNYMRSGSKLQVEPVPDSVRLREAENIS